MVAALVCTQRCLIPCCFSAAQAEDALVSRKRALDNVRATEAIVVRWLMLLCVAVFGRVFQLRLFLCPQAKLSAEVSSLQAALRSEKAMREAIAPQRMVRSPPCLRVSELQTPLACVLPYSSVICAISLP